MRINLRISFFLEGEYIMIRRKEVQSVNEDTELYESVGKIIEEYEESKKAFKSYPIVENLLLHNKYINTENISEEEYNTVLEEKGQDYIDQYNIKMKSLLSGNHSLVVFKLPNDDTVHVMVKNGINPNIWKRLYSSISYRFKRPYRKK